MKALWLLPSVAFALMAALACGGDGDKEFEKSSDPSRNIPPADLQKVNAVIAASELSVGWNNFVFGITDAKDQPQSGVKTQVTFFDLTNPAAPKAVSGGEALQSAPGVGPEVTHTHVGGGVHVHGGEDDGRVGYYIRTKFDHPGTWGVSIEATLKDGTKGTSNIAFTVYDKPRVPAPGQPAPRSDNLTKRDVKDISEIDSGDPPNDMHDVEIKDAIAAGRPLVVIFATPAYCTSRFCGPVVEEVEALQDVYKSKVDFVHIEIWRSFGNKQLNPTAQEWLLRKDDGGLSEPYVYVIGKDGVIFDRWEGPVARNIIEPAVKAVAEGQVYSATP